jgi:hypothetical protein
MSLRKHIFGVLVLLGATIAACGQSGALHPQVTKSDVTEGMREKGIVVSSRQVSMLSDIPVRMEHPVLEVMKIDPLTADISRVLMRCADRISCIPFYVVVSGLTPNKRVSEQFSEAHGTHIQRSASGPIVVKRGSAATLEIVAPEMVITIPVVCLQNGRQGEKIRVISTDQKNTYLGEIVRPGLLTRRL